MVGAVAGDVVRLLGDLLHQLGADLLVRLLELDLLGDGDTIVGDRGGAPLLLEDDVAALRAEGDLDGVGEGVHAPLETAATSSSKAMILAIRVVPPRDEVMWRPRGARDGRRLPRLTSHTFPEPHVEATVPSSQVEC